MSGFLTTIFGPKCSRCNRRRTRNTYRGEIVCPHCQTEQQAAEEALMACPKCRGTMTKEVQQTIIYDKCPNCGGVWLDKDELAALAALATAGGQAAGQANGMIMGIAMASHHHS